MARKHIQQMNPLEKSFIHGYLRKRVSLVHADTEHFYDRASEREFSLTDARNAVRCGLVVEVHNNQAPSVRVLVRDQKGTCAVVELGSMRVVTVYYNDPADTHDTLSWTPYKWSQDIVALVKSL